MAEIKDVVEELVKKTESKELEWRVEYPSNFWLATRGGCSFSVFWGGPLSGTMLLAWNNDGSSMSQPYNDTEVLSPLVKILHQIHPPREIVSDEALQVALDCLQKEE